MKTDDMKYYLASNINLAIRRTIQGLKRSEHTDDEIVEGLLGTVETINNIPELQEVPEHLRVVTEKDIRRYCTEFQIRYESFLDNDNCRMCTGCKKAFGEMDYISRSIAATTIDMGIKEYLFKMLGRTAHPDLARREAWFNEIGKPVADELIRLETQFLEGANPEETIGFIKNEADMRCCLQLSGNHEVINSKLSELAKPLIDYLHENYHPHVSIVVTDTGVEVSEIILSIPECTMD